MTSTISLDQASRIVDAALAEGIAPGFAPLAVVVLDAGSQMVAAKRGDGAASLRIGIASAKAQSCLGMGFGGRELARRAAAAPGFYAALGQVGTMLPMPGGVLIRDIGGALLGAVGISGDSADHDELCAVAGIAAANFIADTGAPPQELK